MKTLLILRHAKSSWSNALTADHDRPLNKRGRFDAPRMGRLLRLEDLRPDLIITSSAERAMTTAELIADACSYENEVVVTRALYHASPEEYVEVLQERAGTEDVVMVVGHNPGMEELVELLTDDYERMPTAALAQVSLPINDWRQLTSDTRGTLQNFWRPKELRF